MIIELFQGKHNLWASRVALAVKNLPASGGDIRNMGLTSGSGRFPGGEHATHSSVFTGESHGQRSQAGSCLIKSLDMNKLT